MFHRRIVIRLGLGVALILLPCWAVAQGRPGTGRGAPPARTVDVETDRVTERGERERNAYLDRVFGLHRRDVALRRARRKAPFDLAWGLEP